jgi:hypothetical protein
VLLHHLYNSNLNLSRVAANDRMRFLLATLNAAAFLCLFDSVFALRSHAQ